MKAAAYARYSTDKQTENSIAYQMNAITKYCLDHDIDLISAFSDEAESGTNTDREGFQNLVRAAQNKEFEAVVIYDISRGSRDVADWFQFRKTMRALGVQVISTNQQLGDITNPNDFLIELINVGLGQHMVLDTRKKSMAGMLERAQKGLYCGGNCPLGYKIENGRYVIEEKEAKVVRQIFNRYAQGESYNQIIDGLNGAVGKFGRPIGKNSLHSILANERYTGVYIWNERNVRIMRKWAGGKKNPNPVIIEGIIPQIIDKTTWERVKKRMETRKNGTNKAKREYLLTGLIECAECGATYVGHCNVAHRKDGSVRENRYYECGNKYRTRTCHSKNLNADELELFVVTQIQDTLRNWDPSEVARKYIKEIQGATADCTEEKRELVDVEHQINNGVKAVLSGMRIPELDKEIDRLRQRKLDLENIIAEKSQQTNHSYSADEIEAALSDLIKNFDPKEAVKQLVQKIYANADGSCTVHIGVHKIGAGDPSYSICTFFFPAKSKT